MKKVIIIDKKSEKKIISTIEKTLNSSLPSYDFNNDETVLDFSCGKCKAKYSFDVMAIFFDSLHNKEKFLVNPICPVCGENENFINMPKTMHFLSYLFKEGYMTEAIFHEPLIQELTSLYSDEKLKSIDDLDEKGLEALDRGAYSEVFRIFAQFIYINPNHHLGYEFIAYAYYESREFEKAEYFMKKAIERAEIACNNKTLDKGLFSVLRKNLEYMKRLQLITRWWETL